MSNDNLKEKINESAFELELIQLDKLANILFLIGTGTALASTDIWEKSVYKGLLVNISKEEETASAYKIFSLLALTNWINLVAGSIFFYIAYTLLLKDISKISEKNSTISKKRILGRQLVTTGNLLKVIGYATTATGFEIIADSILFESK